METTVTNFSSKDLDLLPMGKTSLGKHTISYDGQPIVSVLSIGPVATENEWFEFQTYRKGRRVHINIFDQGCKPPGDMDVPNFEYVSALILKELPQKQKYTN